MLRDPRNPPAEFLVRTESSHPAHDNIRKTLNLLKIEAKDGPIYFVVEGLCEWPTSREEMLSGAEYFYEEHTCPTNFIRIPMISQDGDHDPHGIFEFVDAVWMTDEYDESDEYLVQVFPQLTLPRSP